MRPTEILSAEHRVIERVLSCLEAMAARIERGETLDVQSALQAIEFLRTFADRCHHGKEERHLFQALVDKGWPRESGPVGVMLGEHEQGRALIGRMAGACTPGLRGETRTAADFADAARAYVTLLREHILKEDNVLFVMADRALDDAEQQTLLAAFGAAEAEDIGVETHQRMLAVAQDLTRRFLGEDLAGVTSDGASAR